MTEPFRLYHTKILGTGSAFPARRVSNQELATRVETSDEWIYERTGIRARRVADRANPAESNSELSLKAARIALERAGRTPDDIDLILYATVSPEHITPSTACLLQHKLGATRAGALDVGAACSGFVYALSIADSFIKTGQFKTILVVGAEVLSPWVNWEDRTTCILFGDGAGAAIVGRAPEGDPAQVYSLNLRADGGLKDFFIVPAGGTAMPITHEVIDQKLHYMQMKGKEIFKVAVKMLADCTVQALETGGFKVTDLDWLVPHQANLRIVEAVARRLDFPLEKVILNMGEYGNTSAATVPTAFDEAVTSGKIKRGQLVAFSVFGAGLTYGSVLFRY